MRSIRVIAEGMRLVMVNLGVQVDIIRLCFVASCGIPGDCLRLGFHHAAATAQGRP